MFSVIIPYYKKRQYIERCIDSVLNQTFQDFEIIMVDDGSDDDISRLCNEKYGSKLKLISQKNQGVSVARNTGIFYAENDYIAFLDADDYWSPSYLAYNSQVIMNEGEVKIIGSNYTRSKVDLQNKSGSLKYNLIEDYFSKQLLKSTLFFTSATIISKAFFKENIGFNSQLKRGEDLDVWFRAVASGGKSVYIDNKLVYYSDEDVLQATQTAENIQNSILYHYNFLYKNIINNNFEFKKNISKFVYLNLYPYYFSHENHKQSILVLKNIPYKSTIMHLVYLIPFLAGVKLSNTVKGKLRLRQYLKFAAQYLS